MTRMRRSSRKPSCASSASARPRSASSERSWNSSNSTAATPSSDGSSRIMRANTPSVTTSMRVRAETRLCSRTRRPTVSPTASPRLEAMRAAAARAASRRGSSTMILPLAANGSSSSASGTRVVLPAPGGATSTARVPAPSAAASRGRASSIGSGSAKARIAPRYSRGRARQAPRSLLPPAGEERWGVGRCMWQTTGGHGRGVAPSRRGDRGASCRRNARSLAVATANPYDRACPRAKSSSKPNASAPFCGSPPSTSRQGPKSRSRPPSRPPAPPSITWRPASYGM